MTEPARRVIVVGGGIAGLSAAYRLHERGIQVTVLESEDRVGGKMSGGERDGFALSRGAALTATTYREFTRLADDVGVGSRLTPLDATVGVLRDGVIHRLRGSGVGALVDGLRTRLLSPRGKLLAGRLVVDALRARPSLALDDHAGRARTDVESIRQYCDRRLNPEIRDNVIEPLMHGLYLADAMNASVTDLFFTLTRLLGGKFYAMPDGIDFLCQAIAARLDVRTSAQVTGVERLTGDQTGARVTWEQDGTTHRETVDGCVIAVPAPTVPKLYPDLDEGVRAIITEGLVQVDSMSARFALSRPPAEECFAIVVPQGELGGLSTVVQEHLRAPGGVPPGKGLLVTFWSGDWCAGRMELDDDTLAREMTTSLEGLLPGVGELVEFVEVDRWSPSNPDLRPGNHHLFAELHRITDAGHRVQLAGDYTTLPLIEGGVISGRDAARRLAHTFGPATGPATGPAVGSGG